MPSLFRRLNIFSSSNKSKTKKTNKNAKNKKNNKANHDHRQNNNNTDETIDRIVPRREDIKLVQRLTSGDSNVTLQTRNTTWVFWVLALCWSSSIYFLITTSIRFHTLFLPFQSFVCRSPPDSNMHTNLTGISSQRKHDPHGDDHRWELCLVSCHVCHVCNECMFMPFFATFTHH